MTIEGDIEHAEDIMDHCIEVESNERMRNENIDRWTLRFKQPEIETKVRTEIYCIILFIKYFFIAFITIIIIIKYIPSTKISIQNYNVITNNVPSKIKLHIFATIII